MRGDWAVGDSLPAREFTVDGPSMKVLSLIMRDPNPIHFDPEYVAAAGLGELPINQGTITMAYPIDVLLQVVDAPGQIRRVACRFLGTLVAGDRVIAAGVVSATDETTLTVDIWLDRAAGGRVLSGTALLARE